MEGTSEPPKTEKGPRRPRPSEAGRPGGPDARGRPRPPGGAAARDGDQETGRARGRKKGCPPAWGSEAKRGVGGGGDRARARRLPSGVSGGGGSGRAGEEGRRRGRGGREGGSRGRPAFFRFLPPHPLKEISERNFSSLFLRPLLSPPPFSPQRRGNEYERRR